MKPKMLCLAGFTPVIIVLQATDDTQGHIESMRNKLPCSASRAALGARPSSIRRFIKV